MGMVPDERLARRAARGDQRSFEAIYRRYHQPLYRFCLAMVGNQPDAQDALQNTMVKALRALPGEKREIKLKPWLYRIARNESVEVLRRRREGAELDPELEAAGGVVETAEARERLHHLLTDLDQLHERQRSVLVMRELAGLGFGEIGAALGTSAAAARQALYEARLSLRQMEAGREMRCADVTRQLSDADGRISRRREIRAHLRSCAQCRAFQEEITRRRGELAAIAPLPLAASAGLLHGVLGAQTGASAAGTGVAAGTVATSTIVKSAATVVVATVVGVSAADRSDLVDLPLPGGGRDGGSAASEATQPPVSHPPAGAPVTPSAPDPSRVPGALDDAEPAKGRSASDTGAGNRETGKESPIQAKGSTPQDVPPDPSAGADPPGGGYGSSAARRRGRPEALPAAAAHGQQTAAGRKPPHAGAPSSQQASRGRGSGGGKNSTGTNPAPPGPPPRVKPVPQPKPPPPPPHPLAPPVKDKNTTGPGHPSASPPPDTDLP